MELMEIFTFYNNFSIVPKSCHFDRTSLFKLTSLFMTVNISKCFCHTLLLMSYLANKLQMLEKCCPIISDCNNQNMQWQTRVKTTVEIILIIIIIIIIQQYTCRQYQYYNGRLVEYSRRPKWQASQQATLVDYQQVGVVDYQQTIVVGYSSRPQWQATVVDHICRLQLQAIVVDYSSRLFIYCSYLPRDYRWKIAVC